MNSNRNSRLTSPEITNLFTQYNQETMSICINKHVLATVKDPEIRPVFEFSFDLSKKHVKRIKELFSLEKLPLPHGFTDKDVNLDAKPLFTDSFWLFYLHAMTNLGSLRVDLIGHCEAAILRGLKHLPNFGNVVIKNGWLEKLPEAYDRKELPF